MVDVQGTRYHLLEGRGDWGGLRPDAGGDPLSLLWDSGQPVNLEWDPERRALRLRSATLLFRRARRTPRLELSLRRGADRDRYGNWYWIDEPRTGVRFLAPGTREPVSFWSTADVGASRMPAPAGTFTDRAPRPQPVRALRGLAVTTRHFLVVGYLGRPAGSGAWADGQGGLLLFDLHGDRRPTLLPWPDDVAFAPWDLAETPDGGLLVLDRSNRTYWRLDADFRLLATREAPAESAFQPVGPDAPPNTTPAPAQPSGYPLPGPRRRASPVSIAAGPAGTALILDTDEDRPYSFVDQYEAGERVARYSLEDAVVVSAEDEDETQTFSVAGHDLAFVAEQGPRPPRVYVAERGGNQVLAFTLDQAGGRLLGLPDFLPLRRWGAKALVAAAGEVFYDFADRWVPLRAYNECRYASEAAVRTPADFLGGVPGQPFDSQQPGCLWHRLFLDAAMPDGTAVRVRARAADDPALLAQTTWLRQPALHRRDRGPELPYHDPWADLRATQGLLPADAGTWELLFQGVRGRYVQLELTVAGNGRATPVLRALRAWYPRFSYPDHYLPAIYREDGEAGDFLERWLANFEGFYTELEEKIEHAAALLDPRTAPPEALQWLACWFGLSLDPQWGEAQRRFLIRHALRFYSRRGTVGGITAALRLYLDRRPDERVFAAPGAGGSPVRVVERFPSAAHRFTVLVPHHLSEDQQAMVERLVALSKPAHTDADVQLYWDLFRVGAARVGLDTQLGDSARFWPAVIGEARLSETYLSASYPFDVGDRIVADRDRLGDLPAL